tara:strand:+ start:4052 stop:4177 length:126 start_codon:yes stop_codon:yes gene_type:complete
MSKKTNSKKTESKPKTKVEKPTSVYIKNSGDDRLINNTIEE